MYHWTEFFTDSLLRAPMIGSLFMCITASLVGVIVLIRKRSLVGEALSHAAYPGIVIGAWVFGAFFAFLQEWFSSFLLVGAFITALMGLFGLHFLQKHFRVKNDAALCFILSSFFGIGVLFSSKIQYTHPVWYRQVQSFLYGQPATMTDIHIWMYGILFLIVVLFLTFFYRSIQLVNFDSQFASSLGLSVKKVEAMFFCLLVLAVTVAIRGVGLVLLSGMLIAPALAARQMTSNLSKMFVLSGLFGACSAFFGNYISAQCPDWIGSPRLVLPIGPLIILCSSFLCFSSLILAPERGLAVRWIRRRRFSKICEEENLLKILWKIEEGEIKTAYELGKIRQRSTFSTWMLLMRLSLNGWVIQEDNGYALSKDGRIKSSQVVRLHRLWEVYLVHLGQSSEKVHASAEEMEHVITPELEKSLSEYLNHPQVDPHFQPIPSSEVPL
jgi:manganese/zinc/iron transport system permease protein